MIKMKEALTESGMLRNHRECSLNGPQRAWSSGDSAEYSMTCKACVSCRNMLIFRKEREVSQKQGGTMGKDYPSLFIYAKQGLFLYMQKCHIKKLFA